MVVMVDLCCIIVAIKQHLVQIYGSKLVWVVTSGLSDVIHTSFKSLFFFFNQHTKNTFYGRMLQVHLPF